MEQVELFGIAWLEETWRYIVEDKQVEYNFWMSIMPLARTPGDNKGVGALKRYADKLRKSMEKMTPWRRSGLRERLKAMGVKPGQTVVLLDSDESENDPLFKNATHVIKGR